MSCPGILGEATKKWMNLGVGDQLDEAVHPQILRVNADAPKGRSSGSPGVNCEFMLNKVCLVMVAPC